MNIEGIPKPSDWTNIGGFVAPQNKEEENVEIKPIVHNFIGDTAATSTGNTTPPVVSKIDLNTAYMYIGSAAIIGVFIGYAICKFKK